MQVTKRKRRHKVIGLGPIVEGMIDKIFLSSALLAPACGGMAIHSLSQGDLLLAGGFVLAGVLAGVGVHARFVTPFRIATRSLRLTDSSDQRALLRVCFFSDLHLGEFKRASWAQRVVEVVNGLSPDVILIGGDFVGRTSCCDLAALLAPLRNLRARYGVFSVLGNHDCGLPGPDHTEALLTLLPQLNIRVLRNECVCIADRLRVVGVDELWADRSDLAGALAHCPSTVTRTIVLCHNPDLMLDVQEFHPELAGQDLVFLFGHTHHGQIHLPFLPKLGVPIRSQFYRGLYRTPFGTVYVSAGLGENSTPTRLNTQPEVVLIEL
ncbi:MAG: metallophosphoesterase [Anaerolineae bacterium]|nr:metallophosphoesterase [Thermoflexales bacterium]MDW8395303.1 metallophosphoesterase [Anaerolineae bacterium]